MNIISRLLLGLLIVGFLGTIGCAYASNACVSSNADSGMSEAAGITCSGTENKLSVSEKTLGDRKSVV